ncbi:hypothetical protein FAZ95_27915 [Trinickia violacea]|uniref:Uncharacterized protein n=1 Tax=Trinickia violacea TaxID=2571746 RepID=A0A4P8IWW3_9BURK|nr:hypothetical protein [Trinickia violacea]QCP52936.1 hypothetical protein FAZ95_27915 [Trinickia violacea]
MSTPISHSTSHTNGQTINPSEGNQPSGNAQGTTAQPQATSTPKHSMLGGLANVANGAKRAGGKAVDGVKTGLEKTEPVLGPTASAGYELWAGNNATSDGAGLASTFHGANDVTNAVSAATNDIGMLPSGLDIASTAVGFANKSFALAKTSKDLKAAEPGSLASTDAQSAHDQAKGNLARATPGAIRDVGLGALGLAGRIHTAETGHSLYGPKPDAMKADGGLAIASGAMYVAAGVLQSAKVDRSVDRMQALRSAVRQPASGRTDSQSPVMHRLDDAFSAADSKISPEAYAILRTRSEADVARFLDNYHALGPIGQGRFAKLLHFSGQRNAVQVLNMGRTTNLNTPSIRSAAREDVIDAFIGKTVRPGRTANLFDELKTVRKESLGGKASPNVVALERTLGDAHIDPGQFSANTLKAVASSGEGRAFAQRYATLSPEDRTRLQSTLHFGSWRFWKQDATLPTTKHQRSDIRAALIKQFANGASLDRLDAMKVRYNQQVLPLQTGRMHLQPEPPDTLRAHILAHQDSMLTALKEEKRHAKVQVGYGAINAAAGIAELAVNPAAASGISATRAVLNPVYLAYAGRRGLVGLINQKNARPVSAAMREEALLHALPQVHERIATGGSDTGRLRNPQRFLRDELKLSDSEIKKVDTLERAGKHDEARAFLAQKNPEANALIALRVVAEEGAGYGTDLQKQNALNFIGAEAAASHNDALAGIDNLSDPNETYETLKAHFIDDVSYNPSAGIDALAQRLSTGATPVDYGFDTARYAGQPQQDVARDLHRRFAQDNSSFATRRFVADLFGGGQRAVDARNMLRDFRFSETEIAELQSKGKKGAATWLEGHLFGENLRRRFSTQRLDQQGRDSASAVADRMPAHQASAGEPLTWRRNLEDAGVDVIDNAGTPGLDSMLHALHQNFSGKTDSASGAMNDKVVEARRRVIAHVTAGAPGTHVDVTQHRDDIVRIAGQVFGKPGATVKIVQASGAEPAERVGAGQADPHVQIAGVLCHDAQTRRTFVLHGGDASKLTAPVTASAATTNATTTNATTTTTATTAVPTTTTPVTPPTTTTATTATASSSTPATSNSTPLAPASIPISITQASSAMSATSIPTTATTTAAHPLPPVPSSSTTNGATGSQTVRNTTPATQPLPATPSIPLMPWADLPDGFKALYKNQAEYEQQLAQPPQGTSGTV